MSVAKRLSRLMEQKGVSEYQLAKDSGVPQPTIHRIKSGETHEPKHSTVAKLARALGVSPDFLWPHNHHVREEQSQYSGSAIVEDATLIERIMALPPDDRARLDAIVDALESTRRRAGKDH